MLLWARAWAVGWAFSSQDLSPIVAFLSLVVRILLVAMPGAPSSVLDGNGVVMAKLVYSSEDGQAPVEVDLLHPKRRTAVVHRTV